MQNKPNLLNAQMNVSSFITKDYENVHLRGRRKNKPNQTQFPQRDTQYAIRDTKYKPNQTQFQTFCWGGRTEKIVFFKCLNGKYQLNQ